MRERDLTNSMIEVTSSLKNTFKVMLRYCYQKILMKYNLRGRIFILSFDCFLNIFTKESVFVILIAEIVFFNSHI